MRYDTSMANSFPELQEGDVHIWQYELLPTPENAFNILNHDEQTRAMRFYFKHLQQQFITAHATLKTILANYLAIEPQKVNFATNKYGKPYLSNYPKLQFNLSHSKTKALVAVNLNNEVGIDIEFFSERPFEGIAEHLFSSQELQKLRQLNPKDLASGFFQIWSKKEAFIKACGLGLSYPTKQFTVSVLELTVDHIIDTLSNQLWHIYSFMPEANCWAALCCSPTINNICEFNFSNYANTY